MKTVLCLILASTAAASAATAKLVPLSEIKLPRGATIEQVKAFRKAYPVPKPIAPPKPGKYSMAKLVAATSKEQTKVFLDKLNVFTNSLVRNLQAARKFSPASVGDTPIMGNPFMFPAEPPYPKTFFCTAWQAPNTELVVEYQYAVGGAWHEAVFATCWTNAQNWVVSIYGESPQIIVRGRHIPCTMEPAVPGLAPQQFRVASQPLGGIIRIQHKSELKGSITNTPFYLALPN